MTLVIAMTYLVIALAFAIQIMYESCLIVFTDLKRIKFDKCIVNIQENSIPVGNWICIAIAVVTLLVNGVTSGVSAVTMFACSKYLSNDGKYSVGI